MFNAVLSVSCENRIKEFGLYVIDKIEKIFESDSIKHRKMRFEEFHKHFNRFSTKQYRKYSELFNNPPIYDAYCVGSDQVWNPRCYTNLNPYFLKFVPNISIKFSYASSFGVKDIPDSARKQYIECLQNLSYIGVREETGVDLVQKLTGRKRHGVWTLLCCLTEKNGARLKLWWMVYHNDMFWFTSYIQQTRLWKQLYS